VPQRSLEPARIAGGEDRVRLSFDDGNLSDIEIGLVCEARAVDNRDFLYWPAPGLSGSLGTSEVREPRDNGLLHRKPWHGPHIPWRFFTSPGDATSLLRRARFQLRPPVSL